MDYVRERSRELYGQLCDRLRPVLTAHHVLNAVLSAAFFVLKGVAPVCEILMPAGTECGLDLVR